MVSFGMTAVPHTGIHIILTRYLASLVRCCVTIKTLRHRFSEFSEMFILIYCE